MGVPALPIPYCGLPPSPDMLWSRWNLDPILITALLLITVLYAVSALRQRECIAPKWRQACFYLGWAITAAALVSPLCPLSVSLFAGRVGQHMILVLIGAPLVAAGRPLAVIASLWASREEHRRSQGIWAAPICAAALFAALLWFWHAPAPYAETFRSTSVYWSMHVTLYGAALWLWSSLIDAPPSKALQVVLAGIVSSVQMGFLGALITFAPRPLYTPHLLTTAAWNLTPLQDQQLGGAIMWVPGCAIFLAISMLVLWHDIARAELCESTDSDRVVAR
jgi:putative membrane protein